MPVRWSSVVVDSHDIHAQADWWAAAIGWQKAFETDEEVMLVPPHAFTKGPSLPPEERGPGLCFVPVPEGKSVKNRLHLDLAPRADDDHAGEVQRLLDLGATRVDVGQGPEATWAVLADPEGNEFCVLSPRD